MAMYLKLEASGESLPDFMIWSGQNSLPAFWKPFANPVFAMAMVVVVPVLLAVIIGYLTFLNRIRGVYFSILSQALAMILSVLLIGSQEYTGGSNGLTNFTTMFGQSLSSPAMKIRLYYAAFIALVVIFIICRFLVTRRIGKIFIAIRDGENRVRFTGYNCGHCRSAVCVAGRNHHPCRCKHYSIRGDDYLGSYWRQGDSGRAYAGRDFGQCLKDRCQRAVS